MSTTNKPSEWPNAALEAPVLLLRPCKCESVNQPFISAAANDFAFFQCDLDFPHGRVRKVINFIQGPLLLKLCCAVNVQEHFQRNACVRNDEICSFALHRF